MIIDSHHHYWHYNADEYDWIDEEMQSIRRDFLPADLATTIAAAGVDGVVTVQARQSLEETEWLLSLAAGNDFMRGIVGWLPLTSESVDGDLERLATNPKLKAVRHVVQGEADGFISQKTFDRGIRALEKFNLAYDVLIVERQLPETITFVDRHPNQRFVLDHIAKPRIKENILEPWGKNLKELGKRENVCCKISGMVTEADYQSWSVEQLHPYLNTALEAFGPKRLLFGSDWPVCTVACDYAQWLQIVRDFISQLSPDEQQAILGDNTLQAYNLEG